MENRKQKEENEMEIDLVSLFQDIDKPRNLAKSLTICRVKMNKLALVGARVLV